MLAEQEDATAREAREKPRLAKEEEAQREAEQEEQDAKKEEVKKEEAQREAEEEEQDAKKNKKANATTPAAVRVLRPLSAVGRL